jgi:filamentous hemagglutinin family protein
LIWSLSGALLAGGAIGTPTAYGLPTQGVVSTGTASVTTEGSQLSIRQGTPSVVIDWKTFSVGSGETVQFLQPNSMSMAVNRVFGGDASVIAGQIVANGRVVLINSSGILFSATSRVDVGGLIASTLNLANGDLSGGSLLFEGNTAAAVVNRGRINLQDGGFLALVGPQVKNFGEINAPNGQVALLAGNLFLSVQN